MGVIKNKFLTEVLWQNAVGELPVISNSEVHIWRINISQNIKRLEQFEALLTADEKLRAGKYKQPKDTYRFIVSRGAQRIILGRYLNQAPAQLQFILSDNKKPHLVGVDGNIIHYNLSHSGDWVILAIAASPVGADVELIDDAFPFNDILPDNFSEAEAAFISTSPDKFFMLWTRKEAILKATGQGLGDHLNITPALDGEHWLNASLIGANKNWLLNSFALAEDYVATVVVEEDGQGMAFFEADL